MKLEGGCYCGAVRYEYEGEVGLRAQCFCRECQHVTGGDSVLVMGIDPQAFRLTEGQLKPFRRNDLDAPVTREFCANCGTHVTTRPAPGMLLLKVGSLDDPSLFEGPQMAIYTCDAQPFHRIPDDIPSFEKLPG
jgi:hypothetical protein